MVVLSLVRLNSKAMSHAPQGESPRGWVEVEGLCDRPTVEAAQYVNAGRKGEHWPAEKVNT